MAPEPDVWNFDTFKIYVDTRFFAQDQAVKASLISAERAVEKAEVNNAAWRANANEWRAAMTDRERNFAPMQRLELLEKRMENHEGKAVGMSSLWSHLIAAVAVIAAIAEAIVLGVRR